jgi:flagellar hook-basal body complex protein FliE
MATDLGQLIAFDLAQIRARSTSLSELQISAPYDGQAPSGGMSFASRMQEAVRDVNQQDHDASQRMAAVDSGQSDDLVGAMLSSQQAGLSFSMLMQVRNKVMSAVEDLVKLPI